MKPVLTAAACLLLGGCAAGGGGMYSEPYALLEPQQRMAVADTRPAFVMKIDGRNVDMGRSDPVPVGKRSVEVSIPGAPGMSDPDRDTLEIDAKPCTRYYLAARRSSPTARDWKAFVAENEPIGECVRKFQAAK